MIVNLPLDDIPSKIYYSISEVSEYTGVEPYVLRYWETKFSKLSPTRVGGNQRKYTRQDLELLFTIVRLLYEEGYTLEGAERKLRKGWPPKPASRSSQMQTELVHVKHKLEDILRILDNRVQRARS